MNFVPLLAAIVTGVFLLCGIALTALLNAINNLRIEEVKKTQLLEVEAVKKQYQNELESLKMQLAAEKDRKHFTFTKYHEEQLGALKTMFSAIVEQERIFRKSFHFVITKKTEAIENFDSLTQNIYEQIIQFDSLNKQNVLFLDEKLYTSLWEFSVLYNDFFIATNKIRVLLNQGSVENAIKLNENRLKAYEDAVAKSKVLQKQMQAQAKQLLTLSNG